jgi:phosphomannomutase
MINIFHAYDIRGVYPDEINEQVAGKIAAATVKFLGAKKLIVGEDGRNSSSIIRDSVIKNIIETGCDVYHIGQCTTPLFYFSVNNTDVNGGIMITASHNPPEYNGLKIVRDKSQPISESNGLLDIRKMLELEEIKKDTSVHGQLIKISLLDKYIDFLLYESRGIPDNVKNLKIIIDASNGMTSLVLNNLLPKTSLNVIPLFFEIDGNFPGHLPDTSRKENLKHLIEKVLSEKADLGIAFDGDGDRMVVVDEKGNVVRADIIAALIYSHFYQGNHVVYDLRFSKSVKEVFGSNGVPIRIGHSFARMAMMLYNAAFGGELSGHYFFKETQYSDAAIFAMLRFIEILAKSGESVSRLAEPFLIYSNSGEINVPIIIQDSKNQTQDEIKLKIIEKLKNKYHDGKQNFLDGITVEYSDWWFNVRFSNTEPLLRIIVEANNEELMQKKKEELIAQIKNYF